MTTGAHISGTHPHNNLLFSSLKILASEHPDNHFIFFTERPLAGLQSNCTNVIIAPRPKNKLLLYYWYNYKLPVFLNKYNAKVFISDAGMLNIKTGISQYLFFDSVCPDEDNKRYFKKIFRACLNTAVNIFTTEDCITEELAAKYSISGNKLLTLHYDFPEKNINTKHDDQTIKDKYTKGDDYFLCPVYSASPDQLIVLLKAFSQLKKWQKTSLKLILLLRIKSPEDPVPDFKNYKYREDVILMQHTEKTENDFLKSCFAFVWFGSFRQRSIAFAALQNDVPLIVSDNKINKSLFGEGVLFTMLTVHDLAEKMQVLYKDESIRNKTIECGKFLLQKYNSTVATTALQSIIFP